MHPGFKQLIFSRRESSYRPLPNTHKAVLDCLYRLEYLEHLNISGLDHHSVPSDYNDITYSDDLLEHYLYIISECLRNLGSLVNNNILRVVSQSCPSLVELRCRGPCSL